MSLFNRNASVIDSNIRILHAVPTATAIDIYANGNLIASNVSFGKLTKYSALPAGNYQFQLYAAGTYDTPLLSQDITTIHGSNYTISVVTLQDNLYLFRLKDDNVPSTKISTFLRFMNLSPNSPLLSLSLPNNTELFNSVEYLETTGYYMISSGIYNLQVTIASDESVKKYINNISFDNGNFYTIYIIGLFNDTPKLGYLLTVDYQ